MRTINAIFNINEDSDLAGVTFQCENNTIDWSDLTRLEQIKILNAWVGHYKLFCNFLKET